MTVLCNLQAHLLDESECLFERFLLKQHKNVLPMENLYTLVSTYDS